MFRWIPNVEALVVLGPVLLSGFCSPIVQQQLDQRIAELTPPSLVQEQNPNFCDIDDKPEPSEGMDMIEAGKDMDMGDWAEAKKQQKEREEEIETSASVANQAIAGGSAPPPNLNDLNEEQPTNDSDPAISNAKLADSIDDSPESNAMNQEQGTETVQAPPPLLDYSPQPLLEHSPENSNQEIANQMDLQPNSIGDISNTQDVNDANASNNVEYPSMKTESLTSNQSLANEIDTPSAGLDDSSCPEDNNNEETNV